MQLTAALLQNSMKAYTGMLRVAQGVRKVMQQYYQAAEKPIAIRELTSQLICACGT